MLSQNTCQAWWQQLLGHFKSSSAWKAWPSFDQVRRPVARSEHTTSHPQMHLH